MNNHVPHLFYLLGCPNGVKILPHPVPGGVRVYLSDPHVRYTFVSQGHVVQGDIGAFSEMIDYGPLARSDSTLTFRRQNL